MNGAAYERLLNQINDLNLAGVVLETRHRGYLTLYEAACLENNVSQMDLHRQQVTSVMEQMMDNRSVKMTLLRQVPFMPPDR